ncbi:radical SAM protein [Fusibacter sp. 3D3]|uniref:radical SAM protein n=1 Tax=Fusibacter sp. 3D3 TaxID=1048380 RepID=UPI0008556A7F|nr:4Fe-4S cluster-binding domain-containing protein [Fusibacter sp. 3D3]GAU77027.1 pyruvate formate-lyase activating enzyme [Fusibacter sp. 3D3]
MNLKRHGPMTPALNVFHIESMGTLDGPGIRTVIFLKGCPLRCHYCHNPESWQDQTENWMQQDELMALIMKMKPYYKNGGGVTFSGGEPLLQARKLEPLCKRLKAEGIHVALDTSGCILNQDVKVLLEVVDLIILDVKHAESEAYTALTGGALSKTLEFLEFIKAIHKPYWIRQVIVPDYNDQKSLVLKLECLTKSTYRQKLELLAFHNTGMGKWQWNSPFWNRPSLSEKILVELQEMIQKNV